MTGAAVRHLVLGGTRSGKSRHAERLVAASGGPVVYVATGGASDAELAERVATHRGRRPTDWITAETTDLADLFASAPPTATVLVDDLEGWLVARMTAHDLWTDDDVAPLGADGRAAVAAVLEDAASWWQLAAARPGSTVVVAGRPGEGIIPLGAATRRYVDLHGEVTELLSRGADRVDLVVAGRALPLPAAVVAPTVEGDLREHGDTQVPVGCVDLAVNVLPGPPAWLHDHLAASFDDLAAYPDDTAAREAVARRHGRTRDEVVVLDGAAEGFWLLPALRPTLAACVHPGFTEPEAALRARGVPVVRVQRDPRDWRLDPADVPDAADLVVLGRPDNPTGAVDHEAVIAQLCRPGRTVVVDEAFTDLLPDATGLAGRRDLPGLVVLRSLTKVWGLAGLRVGYLVAPAATAARLAADRQPWSVGTPALAALEHLLTREPERRRRAEDVAADRAHLLGRLRDLPDVEAWDGAANFLLLRTPLPDLRERLLAAGFAVRRGDTFPGLDASYVRVAVRPPEVSDAFVTALRHSLDRQVLT